MSISHIGTTADKEGRSGIEVVMDHIAPTLLINDYTAVLFGCAA